MAAHDRRAPADTASPLVRLRGQSDVRERVELLEQAPLFSVLHPGDLQVLSGRFYAIRYRRGEVVFREGEPAERPFLIEDGKLSISSAQGAELMVAVLDRGQIFGELAVIDRGPRAMSCAPWKTPVSTRWPPTCSGRCWRTARRWPAACWS